jgi:hypothetical protein
MAEGLQRAKTDFANKTKAFEDFREENLQKAAIAFLALTPKDVKQLTVAFMTMDKKGNKDSVVSLDEFFSYCDVERTPIAESIFFFIDGQFSGENMTLGIFLRSVCAFCMFGATELVTWAFTTVATNIVAKAEALHDAPVAGRAGSRGFDRRRNRSVYWEEAVPWASLDSRDPASGKLSVKAFSQLLYGIHPITSALALTVKRSVAKAESMAVGGDLRLFQFRLIVADFPTLLSPIFLLQTRMRQQFLGEGWWATKRQTFVDAREVVNSQFAIEHRVAANTRAELRMKAKKGGADSPAK